MMDMVNKMNENGTTILFELAEETEAESLTKMSAKSSLYVHVILPFKV